jgi:hypothetical protein
MNQENRSEALTPVYPQYINAYENEDEISLVDVWIALLKFRRVFAISFAALVILGMILVNVMLATKYNMSSVVNIGRSTETGKIIEPAAAVINRLNVLLVPNLTKVIVKESEIGIFKTNISNPKDTNLVVIENKVTDANREIMAQFQKQILDAIVGAHVELFQIDNRELHKNISSAKLKLTGLENPLELVKLTREKYSELQLEKLELFKLSDNAYLDQKRASYRDNLRLIDDSIQTHRDKNRALEVQSEALKSDGANSRNILAIEVEIIGNRNKINELQLNKADLKQQEVIFNLEIEPKAERQKAIVKALKSEIELTEFNLNNEIEQQKEVILGLETQLGGSKSRAIAVAELSLEPIGLSSTAAYALAIFMAFIIAGFITLAAMFRSKVNERLATEA